MRLVLHILAMSAVVTRGQIVAAPFQPKQASAHTPSHPRRSCRAIPGLGEQ